MADKCDEPKISNEALKKRKGKKCRKSMLDNDHVLKKRVPFGLSKNAAGHIYVTNKVSFKAQLNKCEKLFDSGASEIIIHGLGAAINKACNLALQLQEAHFGTLDLDIKTSTVKLIDDFEPLNDEADYKSSSRQNSAIHIRVFRKVVIQTLKHA